MFERLFPRRPKDRKPPPQPDAQLALGALLVRVAMADHEYKATEVAAIDRILSATFGLKPLDAAKLRAACEDLEMHGADPSEYARILHDEVPYADRKALANAMWQVALADGDRDDSEEAKLHDIEAALGLSAHDSAQARAAALDLTMPPTPLGDLT
ncbi:MAG: TerB family tellurite resistance protein [Aliishimia sp.]